MFLNITIDTEFWKVKCC